MTNDNKQPYWKHFQLTQDPFANTIQMPALIFPQWEHRLEVSQHLISFSRVILLITGVDGIGKTTFKHQLLHRLEDQNIADIQANANLSMDVFLEQLAQQLNLESIENQGSSESNSASILQKMISSANHGLIVVDDAHWLPKEILSLLLYLSFQQPETETFLHVVLLGSPQIRDTIQQLQEQLGITCETHGIEIVPLSLDETIKYLQHRLQCAGWQNELPFTPEIIDNIYEASGGVIVQINKFARLALQKLNNSTLNEPNTLREDLPMNDNSKQNHDLDQDINLDLGSDVEIDEPIVEIREKKTIQNPLKNWREFVKQNMGIIASVIVVLILLLGVMIYFNLSSKNIPVTKPAVAPIPVPDQTAPSVAEKTESIPAVKPAPTPTSTPLQTAPVPQQPAVNKDEPLPPPPANLLQDRDLSHNSSNPLVNAGNSVAKASINLPSQPMVAVPSTLPPINMQSSEEPQTNIINTAPINNATPNSNQLATITESAPKSKISPTQTSAAISHKTMLAANTAAVPSGAVKTAPINKAPVKTTNKKIKPANNVKVSGNYTSMEQKLLKANPRAYTLQVVGVSYATKPAQFIAEYHLSNKASYFHTIRAHKPWYVVVYGEYETRAQALAAVQHLPLGIQHLQPWPRRMSEIQQDIRKVHA